MYSCFPTLLGFSPRPTSDTYLIQLRDSILQPLVTRSLCQLSGFLW